jgi:adenosylhomocysteine nucleosidase
MLDILLVSATAKEHKDSEIYGVPIHQVGIGKVEAGLNTLQLIKAKKPDIVINFGSCGNLKDYKPGDVKEVKMVYNDFYAGRLYSYPPIKLNTRLDDPYIRCFTTDTFYELGEDYHHSYKFRKDNCDIIEMELYSIASVCNQESIPVYGYKWISDDGVENEWEQSAAIGYDNFKKIFKEQFIDE